MRLQRIVTRAALIAALSASAQGSDFKSAVSANDMSAALAAAQFSPTVISDLKSGDPVLRGVADGVTFFVRALDCAGEPRACGQWVFFANFQLSRKADDKDLAIVNAYNENRLVGRAYVLEGTGPGGGDEVGVDYVVELEGGVTSEHLSANVGLWTDVIKTFVADFRAGRARP